MQDFNSSQVIKKISKFIEQTFQKNKKQKAVIAVSGGIDSAVSISLLAKALSSKNIFPLLLPFDDQDMSDARTILKWNKIPQENWQEIQIKPIVNSIAKTVNIDSLVSQRYLENKQDRVRFGNIMARTRMVLVFDFAKKINALVCGTENKSEKYLGYFTRFGDEASDIEPIAQLYKTQIRLVAKELGLPSIFLKKMPSADLWLNQTDETELGFSYKDADAVMMQYVDQKKTLAKIFVENITSRTVQKIVQRIESMKFKQLVPYALAD